METQHGYTVATDQDLNDLLAGKPVVGVPFLNGVISRALPLGSTGVVWKQKSDKNVIQPIALISREEDLQRLCGRLAQLHSDLSPLSAWCHLLDVQTYHSIQSTVRHADLGGFEAAWTGLAIAEAQLSAEKPLKDLRVTACLATETFAIARMIALWGDAYEHEIAFRFDRANRAVRSKNGKTWETRTVRVRSSLQPIRDTFAAALRGGIRAHDRQLEPLVQCIISLRNARLSKNPSEANSFVEPLIPILAEARNILDVHNRAPEQRLKLFDELVSLLKERRDPDPIRYIALAMLAGYLTTIAAGGAPTLRLAEVVAATHPEITGWAYSIGGIGEKVTWTSGFDGLGRLVSRELLRSFSIDEPPLCDFAFDEASALIDTKLPDPLVHLRIKQNRVVTVALFPGVNVSIPLTERPLPEIRRVEELPSVERQRPSNDLIAALADAIWPLIRTRVEQSVRESEQYRPQGKARNKSSSGSQLAFKGAKEQRSRVNPK